ncbi:MAG: hypothetical protein K2X86_11525 [Cytophagaceae bacterium]|nr:hypothetical protein [Cytophagaceae bacterium]
MLVNQFNQDMELTKNFRIGIPLGKQSGGVTYPEKVEAYYSGISVELAELHIQAIENLYLGRSSAGNGIGFDDYLDQMEAGYNGGSLNAAIKNQFTATLSKFALLTDPLSADIVNNPAVVDAAYLELQKTIVLTKTDMASALSILITYVDNDGD